MSSLIYTYTGKLIDPLHPQIEDIDYRDIIHALSNMPRFGGHANEFLSVAYHSLWVSQSCDPKDAKAALLHDASEAYLHDIQTPLKNSEVFAHYREAEKNLMAVIFERYGLPWNGSLPPSVIRADARALCVEARRFLACTPETQPWLESLGKDPGDIYLTPSPSEAKVMFAERFNDLFFNPKMSF